MQVTASLEPAPASSTPRFVDTPMIIVHSYAHAVVKVLVTSLTEVLQHVSSGAEDVEIRKISLLIDRLVGKGKSDKGRGERIQSQLGRGDKRKSIPRISSPTFQLDLFSSSPVDFLLAVSSFRHVIVLCQELRLRNIQALAHTMEMGMELQRSENSLLRAGDQDDRAPLPGTPEESLVQLAWPVHERTSCSTESQEGGTAVVASTVPVMTQIRTADVVSNWIHFVGKDGQRVYVDQVTGVSPGLTPWPGRRKEL